MRHECNGDIRSAKEKIRREIIKDLLEQAPSARRERSFLIQKKLVSSEEFRRSGTVMTYVSLPTEVSTAYFNEVCLEMGKKMVVPFIDTENNTIIASKLESIGDMVKGPYGISVPANGPKKVPLEEIELVVVPAIAYDTRKMRLGRGKGYYDRFLSEPGISQAATIGLAFRFQVLDSLPSDLHDRPVSKVITD